MQLNIILFIKHILYSFAYNTLKTGLFLIKWKSKVYYSYKRGKL